MDRRQLQHNMYELTGRSAAQRFLLASSVGIWVALAWWLLTDGRLAFLGRWLGWRLQTGDPARCLCLAAAFSVYYIRVLFTEFVFLKRGVSWNEVLTVAFWLLLIFLFLGFEGGTNPAPLGVAALAGAMLFVLGSWMNSCAEYARHIWKQRPENRGRLYTRGLFRYSRHPNYLGDLISFSGICLIAGRWITATVPVLMLCGFVFANIPILDAHLHDHYGAEFDDYAARTRKLIPFLY